MMEYWNFECVKCHKTCRVICQNCHHVYFKGGKITTNSVTKYFLECQNCKIQMDKFSHNCGGVTQGVFSNSHKAITT